VHIKDFHTSWNPVNAIAPPGVVTKYSTKCPKPEHQLVASQVKVLLECLFWLNFPQQLIWWGYQGRTC